MSNLLPRSKAQEFQLKTYWDNFFTKRSSSFEWYGEYTDLCHVLHKYIKPSSKILMAGCGNSKLSEELYDAGFHAIDNIDISNVVIKQMKSRNAKKRSEMTFATMDILDMSFGDMVFDCVLDKGTLDAIYSNTDDVTKKKIKRMFSEIERVLKVAGRYICITLAQEHIMEDLLKYFGAGWILRVHKVKLERDAEMVGGALPVFIFICTKMVKREGQPLMKVYEYVSNDGKYVRCDEVEKIGEFIKDNQQYSMIQHHLSKLHAGEMVLQLDLWSPSVKQDEPRYSLAVVDAPRSEAKRGPFAIFVVPQGRELEELFSVDAGLMQLAESVGFERLVVVTLHRGHVYASLDAVKEEVSAKALELIQHNAPKKKKYPVLSLGDELGSRVTLDEGSSLLNGKYVMEECENEEKKRVRRLIFLESPNVPQAEVNMIPVSKSSKEKDTEPDLPSYELDYSHLNSDSHNTIVSALAFLSQFCEEEDDSNLRTVNTLLIGLGGGPLPVFITKHFHNVIMEVVEEDPAVVSLAEKWFECTQGERLKIYVEDGIKFIQEACASGKKGYYDVVVIDMDSRGSETQMNSPPEKYLDEDILQACESLINPTGIYVIKLSAKNKSMRFQALTYLHSYFYTLLNLSSPDEPVEVIVCLTSAKKRSNLLSEGVKESDGELNVFMNCQITNHVQRGLDRLSRMVAESSGGLKRELNVTSYF